MKSEESTNNIYFAQEVTDWCSFGMKNLYLTQNVRVNENSFLNLWTLFHEFRIIQKLFFPGEFHKYENSFTNLQYVTGSLLDSY